MQNARIRVRAIASACIKAQDNSTNQMVLDLDCVRSNIQVKYTTKLHNVKLPYDDNQNVSTNEQFEQGAGMLPRAP